MAQINFNYRVNMNTIPVPTDPAGYIIGYDLDGSLKQKDYYGNIVVISGTATQSFTDGIEYFALGSSYLESKAVVIKSIFE